MYMLTNWYVNEEVNSSTSSIKELRLTLSDKYRLVTEARSMESEGKKIYKSSFVCDYGVKRHSVYYILEKSEKTIEEFEKQPDFATGKKSMKGPERCIEIDEPLYQWFQNCRAVGKYIGRNLVTSSAKHISQRL